MKRLKRFYHNVTNLDKLSYIMTTAFGLCLLMITVFFQFGYMLGESSGDILSETQKVITIYEPNLLVRIMEFGIAIGLIILGLNRLYNYKEINKGDVNSHE